MTKNTKTPYTGYLSFHRQTNAIKLAALVLIFLLGFTTKTYAVLVTHEWQESHRGYSIELIPGTSGAGAQYVAAGTAYDNTNHPGQTGWHFMRLDANGNVLNSRITWAVNSQFRVVDIAAQSSNEFRITIQAINLSASPADNYVYIHGVDVTGADLTSNPTIRISNSTGASYKALYPTHSYFSRNGFLYIVGYATPNGVYDPSDSGGPLKYTTNKISWIMKVGVTGTVSVSRYAWNSTSYLQNGTDYDMPMRISPYSYNAEFPLLVTGAMNNNLGGSSAYIGKFDEHINHLASTGVINNIPTFFATIADDRWGYYAVDARGDIGNEHDIVILVNSHSDYFENNPGFGCVNCPGRNWGIIRLKNTLNIYPSPMKSIVMKSITGSFENPNHAKVNEWATQFLELHYTLGVGDHIYVVGQKFDNLCTSLPPGSLAPTKQNINPFISYVNVDQNFASAGAGYTTLLGRISKASIFLSSKGTEALNLDYYNGSVPTTSALEDVARLYTFASVERYYDNPAVSNPGQSLPAILTAIGEKPSATNNNLLTKFIGTAYGINGYTEPSCEKVTLDCDPYVEMDTAEVRGELTSATFSLSWSTLSGLTNDFYMPSITDCNTGYYKSTTSISNVEHVDAVKLYPNPTATELNIELPGTLTSKDAFEFKLVEMTGKTVYTNYNPAVGQSVLKFTLPQLAPGVYFGIVNLNGKQFSHKVTIQ